MLKIKNLRGTCEHCGGPIEFHAESIGTMADCPHCGQPTELLLAPPADEASPVRTKAIIFAVLALAILAAGFVGVNLAFKRAQRLRATQTPAATPVVAMTPKPTGPFVDQEFQVSPVALRQQTGNSLIHAVGSLTNLANRQRFGVKVELEVYDQAGAKIGASSDYQKVMEPNSTWDFRALVVDQRARTAKVVAIQEAH